MVAVKKRLSEEHKKKLRKLRPNFSPWNKGKKLPEDLKRRISETLKGYKQTEEHKRNRSKAMKKSWKKNPHQGGAGQKRQPEVIKRILRRHKISSLEKKMLEIIQRNNLPYKFVGNGDFLVGRKCPDFVNCNGEKIAVEVFYRKHKEQFRDGLKNWKTERTKIFEEYGWELLFFDETQVNEEFVRGLLLSH